MKKILSIAVAMIMVLALSVCAFADEIVYTMASTQGQDTENAALADGVAMASTQGDSYCRISTNWVGGGSEWNAIIAAVQTEGAYIKLTYTGTLNSVVFQSENGSYETTSDFVVTEGEKNVAMVSCADIVANSPVALSGDFGGWANFMLDTTDCTLYGFEVVIPDAAPAETPAETTSEPETPAEPAVEAPAQETPAKTGVVLAVLPMAVAAAALALSKKR